MYMMCHTHRYLSDKGRAGVVKLGESDGSSIGVGGGPRALYLAPPSPSTCAALGVGYDARRDAAALLAVMLPSQAQGR